MAEEKKGLFGKLSGGGKSSCCDMEIVEEKPAEKKESGCGCTDAKKPAKNDSCC